MNEVYLAVYRRAGTEGDEPASWETLQEPMLIAAAEVVPWAQHHQSGWRLGAPLLIAGDAWDAYAADMAPPPAGSGSTSCVRKPPAWPAGAAGLAARAVGAGRAGRAALCKRQGRLHHRRAHARRRRQPKARRAIPATPQPLTDADLDEVVALEANVQSFPGRVAISPMRWRPAMALDLAPEGRLAGFCILMFAPDVAHLLVIAVARDLHRQGLGGELMHWCEQRARERGRRACCWKCGHPTPRPSRSIRSTAICRSACAVAITRRTRADARTPGHAKAFRRERSLSMNAVRSPEDIMPAIPPAGAAAPRVNPLQRIWLREIGMEKLWLKPAPAARQVDAQVVDLKGSVRPSGSGRTFGPGLAGRAARCSGAGAGAPGRTRRRASPRCAAARRPPVAGRSRKSPRPRSFPWPSARATPPWTNCASSRVLHRLRPVPGTPPRGLRPWRPAGALAGGGRGAGRTGRPPGPTLRRPFGPAARRHAVGRGHEPRARRVHRQRDRAARPATATPSPRKSPPAAPT